MPPLVTVNSAFVPLSRAADGAGSAALKKGTPTPEVAILDATW